MQIIVLGMHRSGTSAVTRVLNLMGAYVGSEEACTGTSWQNPKGFWERRDFRRLTDRALQAMDCDWHRVAKFDLRTIPDNERQQLVAEFRAIQVELDKHQPWVLKEPRLCLLMPIWQELLEKPVFVHVHRQPLEVASSLRRRNGFPPRYGLALWEYYNCHALAASSGAARVLVSYNDLMADPVATTQRLYQDLVSCGVTGMNMLEDAVLREFLDDGLYRERAEASTAKEHLSTRQFELAQAFLDGSVLAQGAPWNVSAQTCLELAEFDRVFEELERLRKDVDELQRERDKFLSLIGRFDAQLKGVLSSRSLKLADQMTVIARRLLFRHTTPVGAEIRRILAECNVRALQEERQRISA